MTPDRILYNQPGDWLGAEYAVGLVDEIVVSDALIHFEMTSDNSAYMIIHRDGQDLFARFHARPTTRRERRQILTSSQDRLLDHLAGLIPERLGGRTMWCIPVYRRPAACIREWWQQRRAAGAVLCVRVEENDLIEDPAADGNPQVNAQASPAGKPTPKIHNEGERQ